MKKMFSIFLILALLIPAMAFAEIDWTGMDSSTIQMEIDRARAEILTRDIKTSDKGTIILDSDGLVVKLTDFSVEKSWDDTYTLKLNYTVANNSDKPMGFRTDSCYLNGWEVSGSLYSNLEAGKKAKEEESFYNVDVDAEVSSIEELEELEMTMLTFDPNTYMTETDGIKVTVYFK